MRTPEQRKAFRQLKKTIRKAKREKAFLTHPPSVRYAKAKFKKGKKRQKRTPKASFKLGVQ